MAALHEDHALAGTVQGRLFAIDVAKWKVEEEVILAGHEPRPASEYYPALSNDRTLCADITEFVRLGDMIFFVFRRNREESVEDWKDTLLWYSVRQ